MATLFRAIDEDGDLEIVLSISETGLALSGAFASQPQNVVLSVPELAGKT